MAPAITPTAIDYTSIFLKALPGFFTIMLSLWWFWLILLILFILKNLSIFNRFFHKIFKIKDKTCPRCGGQLMQRSGKYGEFIGCSNYPKCKYIQH